MPVGADQGTSTFYTGAAEEAHRPPRGVVCLERKSIISQKPQSLRKQPITKIASYFYIGLQAPSI
ncbi:hypothetical protein FZC78_01300 [Rossellomorea vietnamensis]|uniref:Uncharacterized protein n=1 Tax=Rossellomorea vietnamensis TaxID=218284 RepID=A0A5D4P4U5_9BACI|nr:hypothetical protein FZC78_01300 [Rossellomorea vietnamensis]